MLFSSSRTACRGITLVWVMVGLALVGGGAWYWLYGRSPDETDAQHDALLHTVERRDFELVITERGTVESSGSALIRSEVQPLDPAGVAILWIVDEGSEVEEGELLVELDAAPLLSERTQQKVKVNTAEATTVEAKNKYETALIAREEYLQGKFVQEQQTLQSEAFVKEEDLSRAEEYLAYSRKLAAKGYINELQLQADKFAVEKSKKELEAARTKLRVLEEFTRVKELKTLDSEIVITKAKWETEKNSYDLEVARLASLEDQIEKCTIQAPRGGTVKYAHDTNEWNNNGFVVEEGAKVRERQVIVRLPDPAKMEVSVQINEALIQHIKPEMEAAISPVGADDVVLRGIVKHVNQYAEPSNWRRANVKDYKATISLQEPSERVKAGMTVSVSISSMFVADALQAPIESVYAHGDKLYCFVEESGRLAPREVVCGETNDRFFLIKSGLEENDQVAVNPRRLLDEVDLPDLPPEQTQQAVNSGKSIRQQRKRES